MHSAREAMVEHVRAINRGANFKRFLNVVGGGQPHQPFFLRSNWEPQAILLLGFLDILFFFFYVK